MVSCTGVSAYDIDRLVEAAQPETARLWVEYSSGLEAPLEPQLSAGQLSDLG